MEPEYLLGHHVHVSRAELLVFCARVIESAQIIRESIYPDIQSVLGVSRVRDAPLHGLPGYAQVLESGLHAVYYLLPPVLGGDEIRIAPVELQDGVLVLAEAEEIGFFLDFFHIPPAFRTLAFHELGLRPEGLVWSAVPALIHSLVNVPCLLNEADYLGHDFLMAFFRGADEIIIRDVQLPPGLVIPLHDRVGEGLWRPSRFLGRCRDLLPVVVCPCQEEYALAGQAVPPP